MKDTTLKYYDDNAATFVQGTLSVDFAEVQEHFLAYLPEIARILDFGCGSGRDSMYFLERGYIVDAVDGSEEMCKMASDLTGLTVRNELFEDLDAEGVYDGIWACASVLHLPRVKLKTVLEKMFYATKSGGYLYLSFKYGDFEGIRNGRYFTDLTEESFGKIIHDIDNSEIIEYWITGDVRPGRGEEKWLNVIVRKKTS